tara:strand:+ start:164 stop:1051 length:888 start_codon:yes stop_codon:yes gene_type:complete
MNKKIRIMEVGLRDGLQKVKKDISIDNKLIIINGLIDSGVKYIQVASFVSPQRVPQMSHADELAKRLPIANDVQFSGLVFNEKGVERVIKSGLKKIETSISLSEIYSQNNLGMTISQSIENLKKIAIMALNNKLKIRAGIQCVWGSSYDVAIDQKVILERLADIIGMGITRISICDTAGIARPNDVTNVLELIYKNFPEIKISIHLHNTNGFGLANLRQALKFDIREIDTSMGGIGGSPFIDGVCGNIATEETIYMLQKMGYDIGIDINKISSLSKLLEKEIGTSYFSGEIYKTI